MDLKQKALELHLKSQGKIAMVSKVPLDGKEALSLAYSPGVAEPCKEIARDKENAYLYTSKSNTIAMISDGSAVLGLGDIGALASLPVLEGKAILLKHFANVDTYPVCIDTKDTETIIQTIKLIAPTYGAINLEDISAPRCVEIERRLIDELDIPVFHDDQHGTAIVVTAGIINSCRLLKKSITELTVALSGTGAAGSSVARMLKKVGVKTIYGYNIEGVVSKDKYDSYDFLLKELLDQGILDSKVDHDNTLASIIKDADVFIGVSAANLVSAEMVKSMKKDAIIFAMANPIPEVMPDVALNAGARIVGTGRSDFPNQVNNLLAFPGLFRGALDAKATKINEEMKLAAAYALAGIISDDELTEDYIIPSPFDDRVVKVVSQAVNEMAHHTNVIRRKK